MQHPKGSIPVFPVCVLTQAQARLLAKALNGLFLTKAEQLELAKVKRRLDLQLQPAAPA